MAARVGGAVRAPASSRSTRSRGAAGAASRSRSSAPATAGPASPRPLSQPWLYEAVGTAEWTGTPLAPLLDEAGVDETPSRSFSPALDRGVQSGYDHDV